MTKKEIITLIDVIAKVKRIAQEQYDDKVYDNILSIFNQLKTAEKKVLLKGLINICFIVENKILVSIDDIKDVRDTVHHTDETVDNVYSIEQTNKKQIAEQLIRLKTLITKTLMLLLIAVILGFLLMMLYLEPNNDSIEFINNVFKFFGF